MGILDWGMEDKFFACLSQYFVHNTFFYKMDVQKINQHSEMSTSGSNQNTESVEERDALTDISTDPEIIAMGERSTICDLEWDVRPLMEPSHPDHIEQTLASIQDSIQKLQDDFQSKLKYDAHKEKVIDALHAELQGHKNGLLEKLVRPIILDIIEILDDTRKILRDVKAREQDNDPDILKKIVHGLPGDLEDLLFKHGIETYSSESPSFTPATQKAIKIIPTEDETLDKMICERLKNGYLSEGRLIRQEMVSVYQFQKKNS